MTEQCDCGKRSWPSKADADRIVVNAKIRRATGNSHRGEQRSYQCPTSPNLWHVTSRQGDAPMPNYPDTDDEAAREFIGDQLHRQHDDTWVALLAPDRVEQTLRVLGRIHQAVLAKGADKRAHVAAMRAESFARRIAWSEYEAAVREHKDWLRRSAHFQAATLARLQQARQGVKAVNVARSSDKNAFENHAHRDAIRRLALAVQRHRSETTDPTAADRQLWAWLDVLTVPYSDGVTPISEMLAHDSWVEHRESVEVAS